MGIIRSVTTKQSTAPEVEYRVGRHQPMKGSFKLEPDGDPYPVVELWVRTGKAEWEMCGSFKMPDFVELSRDVVRIGKELCPKDEDEASDGEAVS